MFRGNTLIGSPYVEANRYERNIQTAHIHVNVNGNSFSTYANFQNSDPGNMSHIYDISLDDYNDIVTRYNAYGAHDLGFKYNTDESPEMREWFGKWIRPIHSTGKFHTDILRHEHNGLSDGYLAIPSGVGGTTPISTFEYDFGIITFGGETIDPNRLTMDAGENNTLALVGSSILGNTKYEEVAPELDAKFTINAIEKNISQNTAGGYEAAAERSDNFGFIDGSTTLYPGRLALQVFGKSKFNGAIELNGDLNVGVGYDVTEQTSDIRLKSNIKSLSPVLDNIKQLNPILFDWKHKVQPQIIEGKAKLVEPKHNEIGFIAQEVKKIFPNLISQKEKEQMGIKDPLRMNYVKLTPILVKGMQEQQTLIEKLSARIDELEKKINK